MKLLFVFLLLLSSPAARAQLIPDAASLTFINYDGHGDQSIEAKTGLPPIHIGESAMLIGSLTYRQTSLSDDGVPPGEKLRLSDHSTGLLLVVPHETGWSYLARVGVNYGNATPQLRIKREAAFPNAFFLATHMFTESKTWKYGLGVIMLGRGSRIPAVPAAQFEFQSEGQTYQLLLGFPALQAMYGVSPDFRVGVFATFISNSYLLDEDSKLRAEGDYIGVDRVMTGLVARTHLSGLLWLNTRVGYSVYGTTTLLNGDLKKVRELDDESGPFVLIGLGLAIPSKR